MTKKQVKMLKRIIVTAIIYVLAIVLPVSETIHTILYLITYLLISYDILIGAAKNIRNGQVFDEKFLMAVASIGALCLKEYSESVAVMLFYQVGEWFQSYAVNRSRQSIASLMDIRPDYANIEKDGQITQVDPYEVSIGDIIVIQPGEKVPLDGVVVDGQGTLDTSALTGESVPRMVHVNDDIISGCISENGVLRVRVTKEFDDSTVAKILEMVENASDRKSKSEDFITKFARYYTPIVVYCALALAIIPSLIVGSWSTWIYRACTFLVISCPCALVISVPLSFFGGIGGASRQGVLVKGSNYLETLSNVRQIVFDKTGTLTKGTFTVTNVYSSGCKEEELLEYAAYAEAYSNHPISKSIKEAYKEAYGKVVDSSKVTNVEEIAGHGVKASFDNHVLYVGNDKLMKSIHIVDLKEGTGLGTMVHLACDGKYLGSIEIADTIKVHTKEAIAALKQNGIQKTIMLTGDSESVAKAVSNEIGIDEYHAQLLPGDKVDYMEKFLHEEKAEEKLAFVGDGINDAPVLTRADVGIAMGALGSDAAIEAADIVLMDDDPASIVTAIQISHKTLRIVRQNIWFAIGVKVLILILGALGIAGMWAAVFADTGVACICILNAMRCMTIKKTVGTDTEKVHAASVA